MKITQEKPEFEPITIVLTTREEANAFWRLMQQENPGTEYEKNFV